MSDLWILITLLVISGCIILGVMLVIVLDEDIMTTGEFLVEMFYYSSCNIVGDILIILGVHCLHPCYAIGTYHLHSYISYHVYRLYWFYKRHKGFI